MNEIIDVTEWLPRNSPIINPYRLAKGDLHGQIREGRVVHAEVRDVSIARNLINRGLLEDHHHHYGITMLELRNAYFGHLMGSIGLSCMEMFISRPIGGQEARNMYAAVAASMRLYRIKIIQHALDSDYEGDAAAKCMAGIEAYRQCFDLLVSVMDEERDKIQKDIA